MLRCIRGIDGYLPVPVNRRLWNARPPMVSTSLSVEGAEGVESMTRLSKRAYLATIIHVVPMPVLLAMDLPVGSQVPFQSSPQLPLDPIQLAHRSSALRQKGMSSSSVGGGGSSPKNSESAPPPGRRCTSTTTNPTSTSWPWHWPTPATCSPSEPWSTCAWTRRPLPGDHPRSLPESP